MSEASIGEKGLQAYIPRLCSQKRLEHTVKKIITSTRPVCNNPNGQVGNFRAGHENKFPAPPAPGSPDFPLQNLGSLVGGSAASSLGTYCKISPRNAPAGHAGAQTGPSESVKERFALQNKATQFLMGSTTPKGKLWRLPNCLKTVASRMHGVSVLRHVDTGSTKFSNLQRCMSVWTCPCCSAQITEHRRKEIESALDVHFKAGGQTLMVTLTHSHRRSDDLGALLRGEREAHSVMTASRAFIALTRRICRIGAIRAREMTYGDQHGWHPHTHDVWLLSKPIGLHALEAVQREIFTLWAKACIKVGLPAPTAAHGVKVDVAFSPAEYLAKFAHDTKWGTGRELTKSQSKRGSADRWTPFDLLRSTSLTEAESKKLFRVYSKATFGGRQITWSRGLKDLMRVKEITDEELMSGKEKHEPVAHITPTDWRLILIQEQRAATLFAAKEGGQAAVDELVKGLRPTSPAAELSAAGPALEATHGSAPEVRAESGPRRWLTAVTHGSAPEVRAEGDPRWGPAEGPPPVQGRAESGPRR